MAPAEHVGSCAGNKRSLDRTLDTCLAEYWFAVLYSDAWAAKPGRSVISLTYARFTQ
jgi:hypothetical protein